jgi:hypothetical protein
MAMAPLWLKEDGRCHQICPQKLGATVPGPRRWPHCRLEATAIGDKGEGPYGGSTRGGGGATAIAARKV